jgi:hypothetical protein
MKPSDGTSPELEYIDFAGLGSRIFTVKGEDIFIGMDKVPEPLRIKLREEAEYIVRSRLWEIFNASIVNEAANLALIQSKDWENINFAKALYHWSHFFANTLYTCSRLKKH